MRNLADAIENFIIGELLRDQEDALLVQRNELAERLSCAPSQISYVLSTRFTPERGFLVESRRGSGGFDGSKNVNNYGVCSTAAATAAKEAHGQRAGGAFTGPKAGDSKGRSPFTIYAAHHRCG